MVQFDVKRVSNGAESFMVSFDFTKTPITQVADYIIIAAAKNKTSDIHFDPRDEGMMVRFRIDGDCQDYTFIPKAYEKNLTTRLKLLANMNITETRLPQDGAIKGEFGGQYLDMRVACLPTNQGEKIVIRILDYTRSLQGIDSLGFHPKNLEKIKRMMGVPNGIILVTGATGSGKSTTTYSMLSGLNKPEVNVITVEDPVEMNIEGINQVQVNAEIGMTFAAALRSILREDPNVILIGEIRDSETAQIAVRASITGHLVMSTLHTNNALATVERLLDMDVERYLLSTALTGIVSQRLAKQLCPDCRYQRETTPYEKKVYKKFLHQDVSMIWDANPKGCENCRKGYRGRIAVHEVLELDDHIRNALNDEHLAKDDFAKMIYTGKTISMLQDALIKALDGQTSFEEVYRTIEIENEDEDNYAEEISEVVEQEQDEDKKVNLPTGDDLLEEEGAKQAATPLAKAISIPGINAAPDEESNEEKAEAETTVQIPTIQQQPIEQLTAVPATTPAPLPTENSDEVPTVTLEQLSQLKPAVSEQEETKATVEEVPTATIGPDGKLIAPPTEEASNELTTTTQQTVQTEPVQIPTVVTPEPAMPVVPTTTQTLTVPVVPQPAPTPAQPVAPQTTDVILQQPVADLHAEAEAPEIIPPLTPTVQLENTQKKDKSEPNKIIPTVEQPEPSTKIAPLTPTIELEREKPVDSAGYKIVMPSEEPVKEEPKVETPIEDKPLAPLIPLTPIQEEYTISSGGLDDEATPTADNTNSQSLVREVLLTPFSKPQVMQMESPIYATDNNENEFEAPSFATNSNPTAMANQIQQPLAAPIVINENPVEAPIQNIQAISLIPGVSEETQEMTTGAEVLNDPGIRIAEDASPIIPTLEAPPQQLVIPVIS